MTKSGILVEAANETHSLDSEWICLRGTDQSWTTFSRSEPFCSYKIADRVSPHTTHSKAVSVPRFRELVAPWIERSR
jgi:hypothetical protein